MRRRVDGPVEEVEVEEGRDNDVTSGACVGEARFIPHTISAYKKSQRSLFPHLSHQPPYSHLITHYGHHQASRSIRHGRSECPYS